MSSEEIETPLEKAARDEEVSQTELGHTTREEREADMLVADIDQYVAETNPASRSAADAALNAWEIPSDPQETRTDQALVDEETPLVSILTVHSEAEANIVRGLLESEGIPVTFDNLPSPILGNVFSTGDTRWGDILVPGPDVERARTILSANSTP